jgi:GxxExxY protein
MNDIYVRESNKSYDLAGKVIGLAMKVHSSLGVGFLESVYHKALSIELQKAGLNFESEKRIQVYYENALVGYFDADLVIEKKLIVEIKAIELIAQAHEVQVVNYLVATKINEGLLLNFGAKSLEFKKKFRLSNSPKKKLREF